MTSDKPQMKLQWMYSCIRYSLHSKKYSLQYTMYIIELAWIFVQ